MDTFGGTAGFTALWAYNGGDGPARAWVENAAIDLPVLADQDGSLRADYFIPNSDDVFASNPRHYVIGADGTFSYISTSPSPGSLEDAITAALTARR